MNVFLTSLGCRLNEAELRTWSQQLQGRGHRVVDSAPKADVVVLNTCAVTGDAAKSSRQKAKRLHRENPSSKLVLTGCFAELEPEQVEAIPGVDLVVSNANKETLVDTIEQQIDIVAMPDAATEPTSEALFGNHRTRAFIKIQDGCRNQCTYCIVTVARGDERSRTIPDVVREVQDLSRRGYQEVVITGVHIGGYGHDIGADLRSLIEAVLEETTIPRIRIGSLEPWNLPDGFFKLWAETERLCPHFHLPLQSGSDEVLKRMARRCSVAEYKALVRAARDDIPNVNITTDLIVGFPGETDDEFQETTQTILDVGFGDMHIFSFSRREGTPAARMRNQLPKAIKKARSRVVHNLARRMKKEALARHVERPTQVLWETLGTSSDKETPVWLGYTDTYIRAETPVQEGVDLKNKITPFHPQRILKGERLFGLTERP